MPSRARVVLKLGGRLKGEPESNVEFSDLFIRAMGDKPATWRSGCPNVFGAWPPQYVPEGFHTNAWLAESALGQGQNGEPETVLAFMGEVEALRGGQLFRNGREFSHVASMALNYTTAPLYHALKRKLYDLNGKIPPERIIERVWIRSYEVCFDNSGDM
jgi:hypothetical protein